MATRVASLAADGQRAAASRSTFQEDLDALRDQVRDMGALTCVALECALDAFAAEDMALCNLVIEGDDVLDERFVAIQRQVLRLISQQAPVASDARLLIAAMHIALHLERIGDQAVNLAEVTKLAAGLPKDPMVLRNLKEMGAIALGMSATAVQACGDRDVDACLRLARSDDRVDELNRAVLEQVLAIQTPKARRRWGVYMYEAARQLERAGDHAVDIAEQVWFMVTGELREFTSPARIPAE